MIKGSERRQSAHPVAPLFVDRWSPRAMLAEPITRAQLLPLFEAARWAPSSMNFQPWRMLYALRDTPVWPQYLDLLVERNRLWAQHAGALVLFVSKTTFDDGRPCPTHSFDTGAAWENFALQAWNSGLAVHGMRGFDAERARQVLNIPAAFQPEAIIAVGQPGPIEALDPSFHAREQPSDRRPVEQSVCEGQFQLPG